MCGSSSGPMASDCHVLVLGSCGGRMGNVPAGDLGCQVWLRAVFSQGISRDPQHHSKTRRNGV